MLLAFSSPYAKEGVAWDTYSKHFGKDTSPVVVWQSASLDTNPTLDPKVVENAYTEDPEASKAEWGCEFRSTITSLIDRDKLDAVTVDKHVLEPRNGVRYFGFVDAASGSGKDAMTLGIAHAEHDRDLLEDRIILDLVHGVDPPFSPDAVVDEFVSLLQDYGIREVQADHWAGS